MAKQNLPSTTTWGEASQIINANTTEVYDSLAQKVDKVTGSTLLTAQQASDLQAIKTLVMPGSADTDAVINAFNEVIAVFENSPEGFNIAQAFSLKLDNATFTAFQTALTTTLAVKVDATRKVNGKGLDADVNLTKDDVPDGLIGKTFTAIEKTKLESVLGSNTGDETATTIINKIGNGLTINSQYLPAYVDDVLEFTNLSSLPTTGETGKIYIALDTNFEYRWSGSTYIRLVASPGTTDALVEGATNKYFTENRVLATLLSGISFVTSTAITATDSVLSAFGKLQAQITAAVANLNNQITGINNKIDKNAAQLYFKQYFTQADLDNDFTQIGLTTPATVDANGHIILTRATAGNFDQYLAFNGYFSNDESLNMEVTYALSVISDTNTKGLGVGLKSTNSLTAGKFSFAAHFNNTTSAPGISVVNVENAAPYAIVAGSTGLFSAAGNVLKVTYTRGPSTQTAFAQNLSKGGLMTTVSLSAIGYNGASSSATTTPNTGQLAIFVLGTSTGNLKITSIRITTNVPQTPFAAYYTDSKSIAFPGGNDLRHPVLFTNYFNRPVAIFAGGGDETKDLLLGLPRYLTYCKPKYAIYCIGRNDYQRGKTLSAVMADYATAYNLIKATGSIFIHLLPIPETSFDQAPFKAAIIAAYPNDYKIDVAPGWDNATMLSSIDGVHPTYDGHRYIAKVTYDFFIANNLT